MSDTGSFTAVEAAAVPSADLSLRLKQALVASPLGTRLYRLRQLWEGFRSLQSYPQYSGIAGQRRCAQLLLSGMCVRGETFLDVGAHIGSVLADVLAHHANTPVIAIEAVPAKAAHIQKRFPSVTLHSCAVGDAEGTVQFYVDVKRPGYSSLSRGENESDVVAIDVQMRRIDDLIPTSRKVGVMKIDVEGAELQALRGARGMLERDKPAICFESTELNDDVAALFDLLGSYGYDLFVPNRLPDLAPALTREGFLEAHYHPRRTTDYFAIHRERREEYRGRAAAALGVHA